MRLRKCSRLYAKPTGHNMQNDTIEISVSVKDMDEVVGFVVTVDDIADELEAGAITSTEAVVKLREVVASWQKTDNT
jgi:hypothetical protein